MDRLCQGEPGLRCSSGPLEEPSVDGTRRAPGHGLQKEGDLDRRLQLRLGALWDGKPAFGLWSKKESYLHINCLEMLAECLGLRTFLPDLRGHHVLVCLDSMTVVSYINRQGGLSSRRLFILAEHFLRSAQLKLRSLRATHVPGKLNLGADMLSRSNVPSRRVDTPPTNGSGNMGNLRQARGRPLRLRRQHSLSNLFFKGQGCVGSRLAQPPPLCFSPDRSDPTGNQANQQTEAQSSVRGPALEEPALVCGAGAAAHWSPVAHFPETRPPLSGDWNDLATPARITSAIFGLSMGAFGPSRECAKYYSSG